MMIINGLYATENDFIERFDPDGLGFVKKVFKKKVGGTKVGNFIRKQATLKNVIKGGALATTLIPATGAVGVGVKLAKLGKLAKASKLAIKAKKLMTSKRGKMVIAKVKVNAPLNRADETIVNQIAVANDVDPTTPNVLSPQEFNQLTPQEVEQAPAPMVSITPAEKSYIAERVAPTQETAIEQSPNNVQSTDIAPAVVPATQQEIAEQEAGEQPYNQMAKGLEVSQNIGATTQNANPLPTKPKNNTLMYVAGGAVVLGAIYYFTQKK